MAKGFQDRTKQIIRAAQVSALTPIPVTQIARNWGFEIYTTDLSSHDVDGGMFDVEGGERTIYLDDDNSSMENDLVLAYLLALWDLVDPSHLTSEKTILDNFEIYGRINKEELFLEYLDEKQQQALKLAAGLLVPDIELQRLVDLGETLSLSLVILKFGVCVRIAAYALEKSDLFLKRNFWDERNF